MNAPRRVLIALSLGGAALALAPLAQAQRYGLDAPRQPAHVQAQGHARGWHYGHGHRRREDGHRRRPPRMIHRGHDRRAAVQAHVALGTRQRPAAPYGRGAASYHSYTPAVVGAVIGGVMGHQLGAGRGRDAAAVAGALLGGSIGRDISHGR